MERRPPMGVPPFQKNPSTIGTVKEAAKPEMANITISCKNAGGLRASSITRALMTIVDV